MSLSTENMGSWPLQNKILALVGLAALILFFGYWFFVKGKLETLESKENQETQLRQKFEAEQEKAANLEPLRQQLEQMKVLLQKMLQQLPSKTEMPELIVDISQSALATGIDNQLFEPKDEVRKEFYAEKPIELRMVGTFHQFGEFVSSVASLRRVVILTMHDMSLTPIGKDARGDAPPGALELTGTIKTYRYLDESDQAEAEVAE